MRFVFGRMKPGEVLGDAMGLQKEPISNLHPPQTGSPIAFGKFGSDGTEVSSGASAASELAAVLSGIPLLSAEKLIIELSLAAADREAGNWRLLCQVLVLQKIVWWRVARSGQIAIGAVYRKIVLYLQ